MRAPASASLPAPRLSCFLFHFDLLTAEAVTPPSPLQLSSRETFFPEMRIADSCRFGGKHDIFAGSQKRKLGFVLLLDKLTDLKFPLMLYVAWISNIQRVARSSDSISDLIVPHIRVQAPYGISGNFTMHESTRYMGANRDSAL